MLISCRGQNVHQLERAECSSVVGGRIFISCRGQNVHQLEEAECSSVGGGRMFISWRGQNVHQLEEPLCVVSVDAVSGAGGGAVADAGAGANTGTGIDTGTSTNTGTGTGVDTNAGTGEGTNTGTDSLPSVYKVNIFIKNSHHLNNSTHCQQQSKESRNQPSCLRTGWSSNNSRTNKKCTCSNSPRAPTFYVPGCVPSKCQYASTRCQGVRGSRKKKQQLIEYSNALIKSIKLILPLIALSPIGFLDGPLLPQALTPSKTQHKDIQCLLATKRSLRVGTQD
ncbi:hypothetical protein FHG87_011585 [Trinorchestia longiramus]|nr:hypothetical protein FHG87_011585 [Trinorchestia longiramus]